MSYDQWKLRSPEDDAEYGRPYEDQRRCELCGAAGDDEEGPEWVRHGDRVEPWGWCNKCGWRCEPCPDIEDAYERSGA